MSSAELPILSTSNCLCLGLTRWVYILQVDSRCHDHNALELCRAKGHAGQGIKMGNEGGSEARRAAAFIVALPMQEVDAFNR